ncbi:hypothetical protein KIW84_024020 [Lathyrus oleraceus]|uniref:Uncharacterized protein n=1 Tax=Pisum sativum TaxID=3888 RepID=A0A9D4YEG9_PEA|nr:hypothetical protein KIW84_024020 [Pisum sativum]
MVSFEDRTPNVKANPLPSHGNSSINMVDGCPGSFRVFDVRRIRRSLVEIHKTLCTIGDCEYDHDGYAIYSVNPYGCSIVKRDIQKLMDENYNATMLENGQEVLLPTTNSIVNIVDIAKVTRSGRVFEPVFLKEVIEDVSVGKKVDVSAVKSVSAPKCQYGESSSLKPNDDDEVL